jgi:predicted phage baseplate assembly protein
VFEVSSDENEVVASSFGDGVSGLIPTRFSDIRATYVVGGGNRGNVDQESIDTIYHVPALSESELIALQSRITITNTDVAIGGSDPETLNQIRRAAPLILRANNRAVTLQDYADLSLGVSDIAKANATADVWNSVTVYIAPTRNAATVELAPFYDSENNTTIEYDTLKAGVEEYLENKILLGTTVTISPPSYVDASVTLRYTKLPQYTTAQIEKSIRARLLLDFGYSNMFFEETLYPQDVEFVIQQVPGVKTARVTSLHRTGVALSAATASGTAITYTSGTTSHGLSVGSTVTVTGFSPSGYNVTAVPVTSVTDSTHFSVASTQSAGSATGTGAFTAYSTLVGNPNEIFRFQDTYLTVSAL